MDGMGFVPNSSIHFGPSRTGESWVRFFGDTDVDGSGRITFDELETAIKTGGIFSGQGKRMSC